MTEPLPTQTGPPAPDETPEGEVRSHSTITILETQTFNRGEPPPAGDAAGSSISSTTSARYEIRKELGTGGFGTVSLAWDTTLRREVAIKRPAAHLNAELRQSFLDEARRAAMVKHPGIVVVHDVGTDETGDPFVVYEYLAGTNLKQRMSSQPYPLAEALQLSLALADALAAAHQQGLTHRDLKPANILIDEQGRPHIADFGLAIEHEQQASLKGQVAGTNRYMSPEQVRGEAHHLDGRTDLWSLGVIMYELVTGKTPFPGKQQDEVFDQILTREPRPPRQWLQAIPKSVELVVLKLLAKQISQRYSSASDVTDDLKKCLAEVALTKPANASEALELSSSHLASRAAQAKSRPRSLGYRLSAGAGIFVLLLFAGWGANWLRDRWRPPINLEQQASALAGPALPKQTALLPPNDRAFGEGTWFKLLAREPLPILFAPEDRRVWTPGEMWVKTAYPALLQLGETQATNYSLKATIQCDNWDGETGLFFGYANAADSPDVDRTSIVGITAVDKAFTLKPRIIEFERRGRQYPRQMMDYAPLPKAIEIAGLDQASIQIDVIDGEVTSLFLNQTPLHIQLLEHLKRFPAQGKFGIYSFGGTSSFSHVEIRVLATGDVK